MTDCQLSDVKTINLYILVVLITVKHSRQWLKVMKNDIGKE